MRFIVGIDEVGRGPLAGPVAVCAVAIPKGFKIKDKKLGVPTDSKKLSEKKREAWFPILTTHKNIRYAVSQISPKEIDTLNISASANKAALRAFKSLGVSFEASQVFLDGGLYLGTKRESLKVARTIVRGDSKIFAISIASIIAKVTRDRLMTRLDKKHPEYGFARHKGYGTKAHMKALRKHGPSVHHRKTFISRVIGV